MNNEYYILEGGEKIGPFSYSELINKGIEIDTQISTSLSDDWHNASYLPEFNGYFESMGFYFPTEDNLAGFGLRALAFIIDYILLSFVIIIVDIQTNWVVLPTATTLNSSTLYNMLPEKSRLILLLSFTVAFLIYNVLFETTNMRGSIGKKICKLKVVDEDGRNLTFIKAFLRTLGALLSFSFYGVLFLSFFFSERKQAWYDRLIKTYVIKNDPI